jgi:Fe-S-cluster containining protein
MDICQACGICCLNHTVYLTFHDLREIKKYYPSYKLTDISVLYDNNENYSGLAILQKDYGSITLIDPLASNQSHQYYLGLKTFKHSPGPPTCVFFNSIEGKCRIHEHSPTACRTYPFSLQGNRISVRYYGTCKIKPYLSFTQQRDRTLLLRMQQKQQKKHRKEIKIWNENPNKSEKTLKALLAYIDNF